MGVGALDCSLFPRIISLFVELCKPTYYFSIRKTVQASTLSHSCIMFRKPFLTGWNIFFFFITIIRIFSPFIYLFSYAFHHEKAKMTCAATRRRRETW